MASRSPHSWLKVLPNHCMGADGGLQGFLFHAHAEDRAAVLPFPADVFRMTCLYPVPRSGKAAFNADVLHILNHVDEYQAALDGLVQELLEAERGPLRPAHFDCVPEADDENETLLATRTDQRAWAEAPPSLVGLYHGFGLNTLTGEREHTLYVAVQGCLTYACEDMHNLWQDAQHAVSAADFAECEELAWLRQATLRNHGRLASRVAELFNLPVKHVVDGHDPARRRMLRPTTVSYLSDVRRCPRTRKVRLTSFATCTDSSLNGVLFDMVEGGTLGLLLGPRDYAHGNPYGAVMRATPAEVLPTRTASYHAAFQPPPEALSSVWRRAPGDDAAVLRMSERFMGELQELGFNRNDGVLHLMPVILAGAR